jgi:MoaA/NifB/PqqE/SkfB family radical SAM enzyme
MLIDQLQEVHKKQNISVPFSELEKILEECYEIRFKERITNKENLLLNETPEAIMQYVFDYYVEKNSLTISTSEWREIGDQIKNNSYFKNKKVTCVAPYNTFRFDFGGKLSVCCQNTAHLLGTYPSTSLHDAWFGSTIKTLREKLAKYDFTFGCTTCARHILAGNARNSILGQYAATMSEIDPVFPTRLIFQLHNTCNYACIMCSEEYSSTIHKLRGSTTPCKNVYDDQFVADIVPFLKHAKKAEFIGGEPFLIPIYFKLWDKIKEINPNMTIDVITNGSVFNDKVERVMKDLPYMFAHISLDSLDPKTYAYVRRGGSIDNVLVNIDKMFAVKKGHSISMSPIIQTVYELPDIVNFCDGYSADLRISNVVSLISGPEGMYKGLYENGIADNKHKSVFTEEPIKEFRLKTLSKKEKLKIKYFLLSKSYPKRYREVVNGFINFLMNYN